jgi:hypothetical protein
MTRYLPVLLSVIAVQGHAATVVVEPGDAVRDSLATLGAGDTLYLSPGTYTMPDSLPMLELGPGQDGVVLTADSLDRPLLDGEDYPRPVIHLEGPLSEATLIENIMITGGNATGGTWFAGAGIFMTFSGCTVRNCSVSGCEALFGGGLYAEGGGPVIEWSAFTGNTAQVTGGGLGFYAAFPLVRHSSVTGNTSGDDGGGVYSTLGDLTMENVMLSGNVAGDDGGGLMQLQGSRCDLSFMTIDSNDCFDDGAGVLASAVDSLIVYSSIVTSNTGSGGIGIKVGNEKWLIRNCCVWNNDLENYLNMPDQTGVNGNISEDPLYADSLLRLSQTAAGQPQQSPAVDTGYGLAQYQVVAGLSTRTDSLPDSGTADMGFHYGPPDTSSGPGGAEPSGFGILLFPCPSSGAVVMRLSSPVSSQVEVTVWDACGRRVDSISGIPVRGTVDVTWERPADLPAGILHFRMSSGSAASTARLVCLP